MAVLLCASLAISTAAAGQKFTPSVKAKNHPKIVTIKDDKGRPAWGIIEGDETSYVYKDCLLLTSVAEAMKKKDRLEKFDKESHDLLLDVYKQLSAGDMTIPFENFNLKPQNMVVRDLFDVSWLCVDKADLSDHPEQKNHEEIVAPEGTMLTMTFDLGVKAKDKVHVFTYKYQDFDTAGERTWEEIEKTVNNGDGTVTCTFEHLCVVAICIERNSSSGGSISSILNASAARNPGTGDLFGQNLNLWIGVLGVSAVALVAVVAIMNKKKKN
ncbi:MAG: hypothetical protein IJN20_01160 [Oscillospiraceae bacterium]|nr:hypothetical protein [Oscillospiraceae bacterium]